MPQIDSLAYNNGLSRKNPYIKASIGIFLLVLALVNESLVCHLGIIFAMFFSLVFLAKLPARRILKLYTLPLVFLCMSLLAMVLSFQGDKIDYLFFAKPFHMGLNYRSVAVAKQTFFRSIAGISATYFMALTIPMNQMIYLLKKLHMPEAFIEQMVLMYRFIAIFFEEFHTLERALILKAGYGNKKLMIKSSSIIAGALFQSMMDSFTSYKVALDCKLFDGHFYL